MFMIATEYANKTGVPITFIRKLCRQKKLPHIKNGHLYMVNVEAAEQVLQEMSSENVVIPDIEIKKTKGKIDYFKELDKLLEE